jgi:chromosome segregation ATPase
VEPPQLRRGFGFTRASVRSLLSDRDRMFLRVADQARDAEAAAAELERQLKDLMAQVDELTRRAEVAESEVGRLGAEHRTMSELAERAGLADDHAARASRLELELRTAREELDQTARRFHDSQARVSELDADLASARQEIVELRQVGRADPVVVSVAESPTTAAELSGALEAAEQAVSRIVEAARARGDEELRRLEAARGEVKVEMDRLTTWRDTVEPAVADLKKWIDETRSRTSELTDRLREAMEPAAHALDEVVDRLAALTEPPGPDMIRSPAVASGEAESPRVVETDAPTIEVPDEEATQASEGSPAWQSWS